MMTNPFDFGFGFYKRHCQLAVEINLKHLPPDANEYLKGTGKSGGVLFDRVTVANTRSVAFRLRGTPWTDESLKWLIGFDKAELRKRFLADEMPTTLATLLMRAGEAGVRYLVFDTNAPVLEGWRVYDLAD